MVTVDPVIVERWQGMGGSGSDKSIFFLVTCLFTNRHLTKKIRFPTFSPGVWYPHHLYTYVTFIISFITVSYYGNGLQTSSLIFILHLYLEST